MLSHSICRWTPSLVSRSVSSMQFPSRASINHHSFPASDRSGADLMSENQMQHLRIPSTSSGFIHTTLPTPTPTDTHDVCMLPSGSSSISPSTSTSTTLHLPMSTKSFSQSSENTPFSYPQLHSRDFKLSVAHPSSDNRSRHTWGRGSSSSPSALSSLSSSVCNPLWARSDKLACAGPQRYPGEFVGTRILQDSSGSLWLTMPRSFFWGGGKGGGAKDDPPNDSEDDPNAPSKEEKEREGEGEGEAVVTESNVEPVKKSGTVLYLQASAL